MYNRRFTPDMISELAANEIFVFGSNLAGMHGGGAARLAFRQFGAEWGKGVGLYDFIRFAKEHRELTFLVTRIGCGIAGFRDKDIAPLFADAIDVENVILPRGFVCCLNK